MRVGRGRLRGAGLAACKAQAGRRRRCRPGTTLTSSRHTPPPAAEDLGGNWVEMTQTMNYTQYSSVPGSDLSGLPDPLPFPYALTASDTKAPGWVSV